tara:strand:+ start:645 stop:1028 length:384 start_codon:yes stop_codon:yes gene_type:complete
MRLIVLITLISLITACSSHSEKWYLNHPDALKKALSECPKQTPKGLSCKQLTLLYKAVTEYAVDLQTNPQAFGQEIIALQNKISELEKQLQESSGGEKEGIQEKIDALNKKLDIYLTTVRLFESPER